MSQVIFDNIEWTIEQVAVFIVEAKDKPRNQRSHYYKAAYFFTASIVEALVFLIVKKYCEANKINTRKQYTYDLLHNLPKEIMAGKHKSVGIYAKNEHDFEWKDDLDFHKLNEIAKINGILDEKLVRKLENVRRRRNRIHMQSLKRKDHRYTKRDVDSASSAIPELVTLAKNL